MRELPVDIQNPRPTASEVFLQELHQNHRTAIMTRLI
jgi:hypothetical protein